MNPNRSESQLEIQPEPEKPESALGLNKVDKELDQTDDSSLELGLEYLYRLQDENGNFNLKIDKENNIIVEIQGRNGESFQINDLLPEGIKVKQQISGFLNSRYDDENRCVVISIERLDKEKWQFLLTILHEIGHSNIANDNRVENEELTSLGAKAGIFTAAEMPLEEYKRFIHLLSKNEREAWALSIKYFRKLTKQLDIDARSIFRNKKEFLEYYRKRLATYKNGVGFHLSFWYNKNETEVRDVLQEIPNLFLNDFDEEPTGSI